MKAESRILEVAIESASDAIAAGAAGANRFELCGALEVGGLTPSLGVFEGVRRATGLPILPMLRPRGGDFAYSVAEFRAICADAERFLAAGADGVVCGCLRDDGTIDVARMRELAALARPRPLVCHRAFDLTPDPLRSLSELIEAGVTRILSSGGCVSAVEPAARELLGRLADAAAGRIELMPGSGVRAASAAALLRETGLTQVHSSCRHVRVDDSPLARRGAAMGFGIPEGGGLRVSTLDPRLVAALRAAIDAVPLGDLP